MQSWPLHSNMWQDVRNSRFEETKLLSQFLVEQTLKSTRVAGLHTYCKCSKHVTVYPQNTDNQEETLHPSFVQNCFQCAQNKSRLNRLFVIFPRKFETISWPVIGMFVVCRRVKKLKSCVHFGPSHLGEHRLCGNKMAVLRYGSKRKWQGAQEKYIPKKHDVRIFLS